MKNKLLSGIAIGVILSVYSWLGNTEVGQASVFPDLYPIILALGLMSVAMRLELRRTPKHEGPSLWKRGVVISLSSGLVFGLAQVIMISVRLEISSFPLQLYGFTAAIVSLGLIGFFSSWITQLLFARG